MKKIATLMISAALIAGMSGAALAKGELRSNQAPAYGTQYHQYHGGYYHGGYHRGWRHHGYYRGYRGGPYYGYDDDDGDNAWAGVLPGVVFGTILGGALSR